MALWTGHKTHLATRTEPRPYELFRRSLSMFNSMGTKHCPHEQIFAKSRRTLARWTYQLPDEQVMRPADKLFTQRTSHLPCG